MTGLCGEMDSTVVGGPILSYPYTVYFGLVVAMPWMVQYVPTVALAVKSPPEVIEPHAAVQVTGALAVNCWVCPCGVVAAAGVITMGETTFTLAVELPEPSVATAVIVHCLGYNGALNSPVDEIDPQLVDHVDATLAENCWVAFSCTVIPVGDTETARAAEAFRKGKRHVKKNRKRCRESIGVLERKK